MRTVRLRVQEQLSPQPAQAGEAQPSAGSQAWAEAVGEGKDGEGARRAATASPDTRGSWDEAAAPPARSVASCSIASAFPASPRGLARSPSASEHASTDSRDTADAAFPRAAAVVRMNQRRTKKTRAN